MLRGIPASRIPFSMPVNNSIAVAALGPIGLLAIVQLTTHRVRGHGRMASMSIFPAALDVHLDLNHAIDSTITAAGNEWKYVANLQTDFDPSLLPIFCQPCEFNQVILNLIVNAADAIGDVVRNGGPEKGQIAVQTRNCKDWTEVRIQDTGTGIPEDVRPRVFGLFFTTKEIGEGTGQGLSIERSVIAGEHGGHIYFETEEKNGTTFVIRLPCDGKAIAAKGVAA